MRRRDRRGSAGRLSGPDGLGVGDREYARQLLPGSDPELGEHVVQMPLDGTPADEETRADLRVGEPVTGKLGDLTLLRCQVVACLDRPLSHRLAGCQQLT